MYKTKIIIGLIFLGFFTTSVYGESCEYQSQIDECLQANIDLKTNSIDDFVCVAGTDSEYIKYQVILDLEFKKIDEKMDKFIENLEINKNVYFGKNKKKTYIDGIDDIHKQGKIFRNEYTNICNNVINKKVIECNSDKKVSNDNAKNFFNTDGTDCNKLVNTKLEIYDDIAFSVLMLNKSQIKSDEKKTYDQGQRKNYDKLLDIMMINLGYLERIWQKWTSKTPNP